MQEDPLSKCRKQFFKPVGRFSEKSPQKFSSNLEKIVNVIIFFRKKFSSKRFDVQVENSFDTFSKVFAPMLQNVLLTVGKQSRRWNNLKKIQFTQKPPLDTLNAVLTNPSKTFRPKSKVFVPQVQKKKQFEEFVFKKQFFLESPPDTWKQFCHPNQITFAKSPKCSAQSLKKNLKTLWKRKKNSSKTYGRHKECSFDHNIKKI